MRRRRLLERMLLSLLALLITTTARGQKPDDQAVKDSQETEKKSLTDADQLAKEKRQLNSIGDLHFFLSKTNGEGTRILGFDQVHPSQTVYLELQKPPQDLVANYRFEGEANFHPLAKDGASDRVEVPAYVNMVVVNLIWCKSSCSTQLPKEPGPHVCPLESQTVPAGDSNTQPTNTSLPRCELNVIFVRELLATSDQLGGDLLPAFIISANGLEISEALLDKSKSPENPSYVLNGTPISEYFAQPRTLSPVNDVTDRAGSAQLSFWMELRKEFSHRAIPRARWVPFLFS